MKLFLKDFFITDIDIKTQTVELDNFKNNLLSLSLPKLIYKYPQVEDMLEDESCRRAVIKSCQVLEYMFKTKIYEKII